MAGYWVKPVNIVTASKAGYLIPMDEIHTALNPNIHILDNQKEGVKNMIIVLLMLVGVVAAAQDTQFTYSEVVLVDSVSRQKLFERAQLWVDSTYSSPHSVIKINDKVNATLVLTAAFVVHVTDGFVRDGGHVKYTITLQCKDGRYKLIIADFKHYRGTSDLADGGDLNRSRPACSLLNIPRYYWHQIKDQAADHRNNLIASIKLVLGSTPLKKAGDDW